MKKELFVFALLVADIHRPDACLSRFEGEAKLNSALIGHKASNASLSLGAERRLRFRIGK